MSAAALIWIDGWLDFNHAPPQQREHSEPEQPLPTRDVIRAALQMSADQWVPEIFPHGKLEVNGKGRIWRLPTSVAGRLENRARASST